MTRNLKKNHVKHDFVDTSLNFKISFGNICSRNMRVINHFLEE